MFLRSLVVLNPFGEILRRQQRVHPIRNAVGSKRINARIVSRPERGFAACHRHLGHACDGKLKWGRGRDAENAILPYRPLPFLAGIGAQIGPKQVLPATPKLLMRPNFAITPEKSGRQKINSPSRHHDFPACAHGSRNSHLAARFDTS